MGEPTRPQDQAANCGIPARGLAGTVWAVGLHRLVLGGEGLVRAAGRISQASVPRQAAEQVVRVELPALAGTGADLAEQAEQDSVPRVFWGVRALAAASYRGQESAAWIPAGVQVSATRPQENVQASRVSP